MAYVKWTKEEIDYIKRDWGKVTVDEMAKELNRSYDSIMSKAYKLGKNVNKGNRQKRWSKEEVDYLEDTWGTLSVTRISTHLKRTEQAILSKVNELKLGEFLENGEYITVNSLLTEIRGNRVNGRNYTINQWIEKGLPVTHKRVYKDSFRIVYLDKFWEWAERNSTLIDFSRMEEYALGLEPKWLQEQRRADLAHKYFKTSPWTKGDDEKLKSLISKYKYGYKDISKILRRTEGAIKRRLMDLGIKGRPVRKYTHNKWLESEIDTLKVMYLKGYSPDIISHNIDDKSSQACRGKIERMIKEGELFPRSEFRKLC